MKNLNKSIFKENVPFEVKKIDFESEVVKQKLIKLGKLQQACLDRKNTDWKKLRETYINI